jgi:hypothetical protein
MLTVNWEHIILEQRGYAGTSRRIARMRAAGAQFAPPYRHGSWSGDTWRPDTELRGQAPAIYSHPFSPPDPYGNRTYLFEFWSVNGLSSNGWHFRFNPDGGRAPLIGIGGQWTLKTKAWYAWDRRSGEKFGGSGERGVEIDAFDFTSSNDFLPNDFVDIGSLDPAQSHADLGLITDTANQDGYISTENLTEPITITARKQLEDERHLYRYQFSHWQVIRSDGSPMPEVNSRTITVHRQNKMKAYAFYRGYDRVPADGSNLGRVEEGRPTIGDSTHPGQVEDEHRTVALVVGPNGVPVFGVGPNGEIGPLVDPVGPYEFNQIVEFLRRVENDLHKHYKP